MPRFVKTLENLKKVLEDSDIESPKVITLEEYLEIERAGNRKALFPIVSRMLNIVIIKPFSHRRIKLLLGIAHELLTKGLDPENMDFDFWEKSNFELPEKGSDRANELEDVFFRTNGYFISSAESYGFRYDPICVNKNGRHFDEVDQEILDLNECRRHHLI